MNYGMIMAACSALVLGHGLFLAFYFWQLPEKKRLTNRLLALLLLALGVRISKSVVMVLFPGASDFWPALGVVGLSAIGPFLWLYVWSALNSDFNWSNRQLLHFIPGFGLILTLPFISEKLLYYYYVFAIFHMIFYWGLTVVEVWKKRAALQRQVLIQQWMMGLLSGVLLIWMAFYIQLQLDTYITYVIVTMASALVLYGLSFWALRKPDLFRQLPLEMPGKEEDKQLSALAERILHFFEKEDIYTDSNLTLAKLSGQMNEQAYLISRAINSTLDKSFPELLYTYRIRAAEKMLSDPDNKHLSIEAIAYDCGFNSLSSFYTAFKKINRMTPAEYRNKILER